MAVSGSLLQSKQIPVSQAASIFARFAAAQSRGADEHAKAAAAAGARGVAEHVKAGYLRLASTAFAELLELQKEVGAVEKPKKKMKKRGRRCRDESRISEEEESDDEGQVVDSNMKRPRREN